MGVSNFGRSSLVGAFARSLAFFLVACSLPRMLAPSLACSLSPVLSPRSLAPRARGDGDEGWKRVSGGG